MLVIIYTPGWREAPWKKVSCPTTQFAVPSHGLVYMLKHQSIFKYRLFRKEILELQKKREKNKKQNKTKQNNNDNDSDNNNNKNGANLLDNFIVEYWCCHVTISSSWNFMFYIFIWNVSVDIKGQYSHELHSHVQLKGLNMKTSGRCCQDFNNCDV